MQLVLLLFVGVITGSVVALQSVLNASLGRYAGSLGAVFVVATVSIIFIVAAILVFPETATLKHLPGPKEWYLYLGGLFGILIVAAPIILVPKIGTTATVTSIIAGQLVMAVIADQIGLLGTPRILASLPRIIGIVLLAAGAFLVVRN